MTDSNSGSAGGNSCSGSSSGGGGGNSSSSSSSKSSRKPPPMDLSHHLSRTTRNRDASSIKQFYKYFSIPGIGQLAGGELDFFFLSFKLGKKKKEKRKN